jgi:CRISPR-associated protein Csm3
MSKLEYKIEIVGIIEVITGLHIGGSDVDLNIGGIDNEVAKHNERPYIPGSSLSGKLRHLIAKAKGYKYMNFDTANKADDLMGKNWDREYLALLFAGKGFYANYRIDRNRNIDQSHNNNGENSFAPHTRLLIRDDFELAPDTLIDKVLEDKAENTINRNTGEANPRHIERVVSGTKFKLNMVMDIYQYDDIVKLCETLHLGINLLNNDYLGGMGSRGSGAVKITIGTVEKLVFNGGEIIRKPFTDYIFNDL